MGPARTVTGTRMQGTRAARWLRALSGLLAGGLVALVVALAVGWFVATRSGTAGPDPSTLLWHAVAAVAAVVAQRYADRHPDAAGAVAAGAVVAVTVAVLAGQWLA